MHVCRTIYCAKFECAVWLDDEFLSLLNCLERFCCCGDDDLFLCEVLGESTAITFRYPLASYSFRGGIGGAES